MTDAVASRGRKALLWKNGYRPVNQGLSEMLITNKQMPFLAHEACFGRQKAVKRTTVVGDGQTQCVCLGARPGGEHGGFGRVNVRRGHMSLDTGQFHALYNPPSSAPLNAACPPAGEPALASSTITSETMWQSWPPKAHVPMKGIWYVPTSEVRPVTSLATSLALNRDDMPTSGSCHRRRRSDNLRFVWRLEMRSSTFKSTTPLEKANVSRVDLDTTEVLLTRLVNPGDDHQPITQWVGIVPAGDDGYIWTLNDESRNRDFDLHTVEGTLENVKSDFTINIVQPIRLTRRTWYCILNCMTFNSKIINYNGSYDDSGPKRGSGVNAEKESDVVMKHEKKRKGAKLDDPVDVECTFAILAKDGDGNWRLETPTPQGRHMTVTFRDMTDAKTIADDINMALVTQIEPVTYPPIPNLSAPDTMMLQFYRNQTTEGEPDAFEKDGDPLHLEPLLNRCGDIRSFLAYIEKFFFLCTGTACIMVIGGNDRLTFTNTVQAGFIVTGDDRANLERMIRIFCGGDGATFINTGTSAHGSRRRRSIQPRRPLHLVVPVIQRVHQCRRRKVRQGGVHLQYQGPHCQVGKVHRDDEGDVTDRLYPLLHADIHQTQCAVPSGTLRLRNLSRNDFSVRITGMPCDIIPKALGATSFGHDSF
ncbi:hypothetical protein CAPTEDRAFT_213325 [Capitella teleta]|uniref:Uncharacterized protein n=1 Tax=Capitella teleta TaxID=283909 RepID=R7TXC0_CAPTE|nr:hypothetical protein CAPTEDRAFT_213325 [Capitella teleta]|eukprot:ELT95625.1 hypothetical protein CAPTEDRAFT_213325 [Capitella teleta]